MTQKSIYRRLVEMGVFDFQTAKRVRIDEPKLGVIKYLIQLAILTMFIVIGVYDEPWLVTEVPSGSAVFWGTSDPSTLANAQASSDSYCNGVSYGDTYCLATSLNKTCNGPPPFPGCDGIFCEYDIGCASFPFSEMNIKTPTEMFFMTIMKDYNRVIASCGEGSQELNATSCDGSNGWTYQVINKTLGTKGLCSCTKMQNIFARGVETIELTVGHTITTGSVSLGPLRGKDAVNLPTHVYQYDENMPNSRGKKLFSVKKGDRIQKSLESWLEAVGLDSLDAHNAVGTINRPPIDGSGAMDVLPYRITGAQIALTFDYRSADGQKAGKPSSGDLECHVTARLNGGWHSRGSEVHYTDEVGYTTGQDFPRFDTATGEIEREVFHDRYKRGVRFSFEFTGLVGEFQMTALLSWLASLLIFLSLAETIVGFVVFNLLGFKSKVYTKSVNESVVLAERGARAALQAVQAFDVFHKLATTDPKTGQLVVKRQALAVTLRRLAPSLSDHGAEALAATAMVFDVEDNGLTFEEWAKLTTEGSLSIEKWADASDQLLEEAAGAGVEKLVSPGAAGPQQRLPQGGSSKVAPLVDAENVTDVAKQKARVSMVVEVPEGTEPGTQLLVPGPGGANVAILVPPGARPGTKLTVQY